MTIKQQPPPGIDPKRYFLCLLGPLALGLSVGMQATMTAFLFLGPAKNPALAEQLTQLGQRVARPEHDLLIFVAGTALTLAAVLVAVWYWRSKLACLEAAKVARTMTASALVQGVLAVTSLLTFHLLMSSCWFSRDYASAPSAARLTPESAEWVSMLLPGVIALLCAVFDLECGGLSSTASATRFEVWRQRINKVLLYAMPFFILLVVGVPPGRWNYLAGQFFMTDACHHLNFFMMGPAISFAHGKAFGTEIYSQYGIGWPLLASALSRSSALTYGNLIGMETVYGCVYYLALFFLLRICFKQELWAAFGVVLAIYWQMFSGVSSSEVIWVYPSSTMMRHPMDVWFFLALVIHQRSGKLFWAALAGLAAALGILFETETGVYLLVTFFVYSILQAGLTAGERRTANLKGWLLSPLTFYSAVAVTLLPLLLYASRGALFTRAFLRGWLEALFAATGQGISALPIAELPDAPMLVFLIMVTVYLAVIAYAVIRGWHQSASRGTVLLATAATYALAVLLVFVSRSHPFNLAHAAIPFAVILTALMLQGYKVLEQTVPRSLQTYAPAGGLVLLLLAKAEFQHYPSLLASCYGEAPTGGLSLRSAPRDMSGLPPQAEGFIREVQAVCSTIQSLAPDGKGVAILDQNDTMLYCVADTMPWSRYTSLFHMIFTQQSLADIQAELVAQAPKYVVTRAPNALRPPNWEFVWAPLRQAIANRYVLHQTVGSYEIWQRTNQP